MKTHFTQHAKRNTIKSQMSPQFSIALQTDKPINVYGRLAAQIEQYGFDGISVYNDMLYQPAWLPLLEIAKATDQVRLGPAAVNPFTCHPINIAGNIALIDEASHGRAYCGFARGAWLDFIGLNPPQPITAVRAAMKCVRHLLSQSTEPFTSSHYPLAGGDTLRWPNIRSDIPFLLGSWGPKMIRAGLPFTSEIKLGGTANPGAITWLKSLLDGRNVDIVVGAVTVVAEDGAAARHLAKREIALYLPVVAELDPSLHIDPERISGIKAAMNQFDVDTAVAFISDELLHKFAFAGTPDEIVSQTNALIESGASRIEFGTPHGISTDNGLRLLGEIVLPQLKKASQ